MKTTPLRTAALAALLTSSLFLGCDGGPVRYGICEEGERLIENTCIAPYEVRVNSVGFLTNRKKLATWVGGGAEFEIVRVSDEESVLSGTATGPALAADTQEQLYTADFTELVEEGEYFVSVPGLGRSPKFRVGPSVFGPTNEVAMLGLYGQRCGVEVEIEFDGSTFSHDECHREPASLERVGGGERDDTGGWHDAGDYGKYVVNGAFAVAFLLQAFEHTPAVVRALEVPIPERGNDVPDVLDEARVEIEWILKTQFDDGSFSHKVTAQNFEGNVAPERDSQERFFISASSAATADAVAALALAARVYREFDADFSATCLEAALLGQQFLDENPDLLRPDQTDILTGGYDSGTDEDERLWALAELWETTGEAKYLTDLEGRLGDARVSTNFDWAGVQNLGLGVYLRSTREGRDPARLSEVGAGFVAAADAIVAQSVADAYGRGTNAYYWGINGVLARLSYTLMGGHFVEPKVEYLDAIQRQLDYLFGNNPYGRSFVTGVGANPAQKPHHRPSQADANFDPWPGLLVGGPHGQGIEDPTILPALAWEDDENNYWHNEIAINWNTALTYALFAIEGSAETGAGCGCVTEVPPGEGGAGGAGGAGP